MVTGAAGAIGGRRGAARGRRVRRRARTDIEGAEFPCDVRDEASVVKLRDAVEGQAGLALAAGQHRRRVFEHDVPDLAVEDYDRIVDVNLKGTFLTCRRSCQAMLAEGSGCIVNIASTAGIKGGHRRACTTRRRAASCCSRAAWRSTAAVRRADQLRLPRA